VLLPAAAMSGLSLEQVEALLAHELAHVRRHDYLVNLLQSAVETLLFYHPAVWLVSRRVRQERELCCDDLAISVCSDRVAYASALADLESLRAMPSPALAATGGSLLTRVRRILGHDEVSALAGRSQSLAGVAILASIILLAGGQAARARAEDAAKNEPIQAAPKPSQTPAPIQSVVGGIVGGVVGGVKGGVSKGVNGGVVGGPQGAVVGGVDGGVQGGVQGGVVKQNPELIVEADDDLRRLAIGDEILVWVRSPINQPEFSSRSFSIQADGTVRLPHLSGPLHLAGLNVGDARQLIRKTLIDSQQYLNPTVEMSLIAGNAKEPKEIAPEQQVIGPFRVGDHIRIDVGDPQASDSFRLFATIQPDGTVATSPQISESVFAVAKLKLAGETANTIAAVIADRYRVRNLPVPPIDVTFDDRNQVANISRYARRQSPAAVTTIAEQTFSVDGYVKKPGKYNWETGMTLEKALAAAGGVTVDGAPNRISVKRKDPKTGDYITIKAAKMDMAIEADDVITVPPRYF
jgi:protein involved in polysaccharide export with SLBB domain